ncbi:MAG: PD40 domain-containing protein [Acidobacteria bacterium]|nr:PD40 domain-containing protein [Acidobacteriota bacterium]
MLYEMATGRLPFQGTTSAGIFNAIINKAPIPVGRVNPELPVQLEWVISKALEKDRKLRYQSATELRADLARLKRETESGRAVTAEVSSRRERTRRPWQTLWLWGAAAALIAALAGLAVWSFTRTPSSAPAPVMRFTITLPPGERLAGTAIDASLSAWPVALSPDGRYIAYAATRDAVQQIFLRAIDNPTARGIPGTEGASGVFFSPDSQWLGFVTPELLTYPTEKLSAFS